MGALAPMSESCPAKGKKRKFGGRYKMRKLLNVMAFFVISVLLVSLVSAAPVSESTLGSLVADHVTVMVNDEEVDENTLLVVEEGEKLEIEVELKLPATVKDANNQDVAAKDAKQIEVLARLSGYEYSDYVSLQDASDVFDLKAGTKRTVDLEVTVPSDLSNGKNTLRVLVFDRNSEEIVKTFVFHVESPRHAVGINDVYFSPGETVKAGRALLVTPVLENYGDRTEEDVVVTVEIPALGVKATEVVKELEADERKDVPEMFLPIPATAAAGTYDVKVTAKYDRYETVTKTATVTIVAGEMTKADKVLLAVGPGAQTVAPGKTATFGVALSNEGTTTKAFTFDVVTGGDWATASVSEMLVVLSSGQNKVVYVDVTPAVDAPVGQHAVSVAVKAGSETVQTLPLQVNVAGAAPAQANDFNLRNGLEIALIVLVVLLVIIGLIVGFSRLKKDDEEEQTYY
ncbi:hypothetical protein J4210_02805 [Candidatus Woesearchaeota archaeon]|nr:hypothetical protein [Candidatus Woesearchaeota archaeon]